jgi:hypothetical protein
MWELPLTKNLKASFDVIPAKAAIQCFRIVLDTCLRRYDEISGFYVFVIDDYGEVKKEVHFLLNSHISDNE